MERLITPRPLTPKTPCAAQTLSCSADNTERVDTRVLQVIYALEPTSRTVYVGMQLDVFIDAEGGTATVMRRCSLRAACRTFLGWTLFLRPRH